ncbi:hypothetical protein E1H12_11135 [Geitlerinema sp. P-1104]|jgi:hypothetical protein|uniref:hypothetical protein n=1 Tax=Cyanophyceae TaxID=3028117 RepID=UPI0014777F1A|nr:hypothetical protein [Geitlerinema sp. P-1104]NMG59054.1 hypothetical protein [Geitlerinema sp. P-1104]
MKPQNTLSNPSFLELLECLISNVVGLYIDSYLGFSLSLILVLYHWQHRRGGKDGENPFSDDSQVGCCWCSLTTSPQGSPSGDK